MVSNIEGWLKRAERFSGGMPNAQQSGEALQFAISMAVAFYGAGSPQLEMIQKRSEAIGKEKGGMHPYILIYQFASGAIQNMAEEIKGGLISSVRLEIAGESLADLIAIAREALSQNSIQVAAVLTAAAFEDLLRRLAKEKASINERIKLEQVVNELKDRGVLQGGEPSVVQSFLKFRNDSLHADWDNVKELQVSSCLALLDSLIVKHFS